MRFLTSDHKRCTVENKGYRVTVTWSTVLDWFEAITGKTKKDFIQAAPGIMVRRNGKS